MVKESESVETGTMPSRVHHINFLVADLEDAIRRYESAFNISICRRESLPGRGVDTARFQIGETWIVLVCPSDPDNIPGQHLAKHGEGFFLLSLEVEDLEQAAAAIEAAGGRVSESGARKGLDEWQVIDLDPDSFRGARIQLVQAANAES